MNCSTNWKKNPNLKEKKRRGRGFGRGGGGGGPSGLVIFDNLAKNPYLILVWAWGGGRGGVIFFIIGKES